MLVSEAASEREATPEKRNKKDEKFLFVDQKIIYAEEKKIK